MKAIRLILAGATWPERLLAAAGALCAVVAIAFVGRAVPLAALTLLVAPVGASAILVFAVPASPLSQPWNVVAGSIVSVLVGMLCVGAIGAGPLAAGLALGGAIIAMSLLRCLHPPGGACALLPVLAAPGTDWRVLTAAIALDAVLLTLAGLFFHRFSRHSYPHRASPPATPPRLLGEDIDAALAEAGDSFDVSRADLEALLERAERHAEARRRRK